jgi:hypothetical protein
MPCVIMLLTGRLSLPSYLVAPDQVFHRVVSLVTSAWRTTPAGMPDRTPHTSTVAQTRVSRIIVVLTNAGRRTPVVCIRQV